MPGAINAGTEPSRLPPWQSGLEEADSPRRSRNCLGLSRVDNGQSRVPEPPERMTGRTGVAPGEGTRVVCPP